MYCGNCGAKKYENEEVCSKCGASKGAFYCRHCGTKLAFGAEFCVVCGNPVKYDIGLNKDFLYSEKRKSRSLLIALLVLFGGSGIPTIYLGHKILGSLLFSFHILLFILSFFIHNFWIAVVIVYLLAFLMGRLILVFVFQDKIIKDADGIPLKRND